VDDPGRRRLAAQVARLAAAEAWVLDGNYGGTLDLRLPRADLVVWLDPHPIVCEYRAVRRWWRGRGGRRADLPEGCDENIDADFLRYIWRYRRVSAPRLARALAEHAPEVPVVRLTVPGRSGADSRR
jgi:adenylate kinase family enzyme